MFPYKILVVFIVHFAVNLAHGQKDVKFFRKDYVYLDATKSFYKINSLPKNFFDAKRACALEGASLWYPENQEEADAVISYWNSTQHTWWSVTLGMSDLLVKGLFETIDGKPVADVYHNWSTGEPNDSGTEDCVVIMSSGKMNDVSCNRKFPYFCKKTLQSLEWNKPCNMPDLDYHLNEKSGNCYKFNEGWQTVQGTPVNGSIALWGSRLNEGSHDQCGAMFYTGRLTQVDCGLKCSFICEHEVSSETENEENFQ
ncbi:hypothetical protein PYW07_015102 [Mythimna separata]|uniref:C-type lectin domain-containing protein n=1 Tax=Mythimna separata TaxID=271217 RepID=A0AAD7YY58_MYTSE|nr:hypothetical protein PYW07_015102 [Mythimna separata]